MLLHSSLSHFYQLRFACNDHTSIQGHALVLSLQFDASNLVSISIENGFDAPIELVYILQLFMSPFYYFSGPSTNSKVDKCC